MNENQKMSVSELLSSELVSDREMRNMQETKMFSSYQQVSELIYMMVMLLALP